ncbi:cytochrome P450 2J3-like [Clavelina lepadiformis]|uniref:cytochrome P450 2J3-like n=1 Tax=Clavelina lepadiformis TaxID=159417 RepID=UPI0040426DB6
MDFYICIIFLLIIFIYLVHLYLKRPTNFPPGPLGLPVFGVAHKIGDRPELALMKISDEYGAISSVKLLRNFTVVLSDYEGIHEAFVKQGHIFSGRPHNVMFDVYAQNTGIATTDGLKWKEARRFAVTTLKKLGSGKTVVEEYVLEEALELCSVLQSMKKTTFDITQILVHSVANIVCRISFGKRYNHTDVEFIKTARVLVDWFNQNSFAFMILTLAPFLRHFPPFRHSIQTLKEAREKLCLMLLDVVKERQESYDANEIRDFVDAYMEHMDKENDKEYVFNEAELLGFIRDMFVAGTDTTVGTFKWTVLFLINRPAVQKKMQKEIDKVVGPDGRLKLAHLNDLHYTQAVMYEMLRVRTIAPLGLAHRTVEDTMLCGYNIPKGTQVTANIWALHHDPSIWSKPDEFRPERFLDDEGNFQKPSHFLPFSTGFRHCMGKELAMMEYFFFLVTILQRFHLKPASSKGLPLTEECKKSGIFLTPPDFQMKVTERFTRARSIKEYQNSMWD